MSRLAQLYFLYFFSTAGLILGLLFLSDIVWLWPAFMMIGLILVTNLIVIVLQNAPVSAERPGNYRIIILRTYRFLILNRILPDNFRCKAMICKNLH